jgi:hypothetical protein
MPKVKISEYSATANSNTDVASINIDEGCAPSGINNAIRAVMGHLKDFQQGTNGDPFNGPHNGTVGATTPAAGAFTSLTASTTLGVTGVSTLTGGAVIEGMTVGKGAGAVSTNTAVGASALAGSNSGTGGNTALGYGSLQSNSTGPNNTAVGNLSGYSNTTGGSNTSLGGDSLYLNTTGNNNVALGRIALYSNTTGASNVAIGRDALLSNTTASNNTAVGYQAGYANTTGGSSVYIGNLAGYTSNNNGNTFIGFAAGYFSTGTRNTFVGGGISGSSDGAGSAMTTGSKNTIIGAYNGNQGGLDIRTASNYCVLSDGDGNIAGRWVNGGGWFQLNNSASWSTTSDARIKENIETITNGLDVVMALRPVEFDYKLNSQHMAGFLAQEYELILPDQITEESNVSDEIKELTNGEAVKGIQQNLVPYLVSAIQSLKAEFDAYKAAHP